MSPYGAASVLIAISEGVLGNGHDEIQRTMRLPVDKSVVRIGLRDVHRHLKVILLILFRISTYKKELPEKSLEPFRIFFNIMLANLNYR